MTQSPCSAEERADRLLTMGRRLLQLIQAEIVALRERRLDGASIDFEEKERLAHAYRLEITHIKADPTLLNGVRPDQKHDLRELSSGLEAALSGHQTALSAMKEVSEGLVRSIAGEIASARSGPAGYGRSGALQSGARPDSSGVTINARA
ncbi:MAG: flagellar basal-body protein FlbY [Alphaproteobacteria bacterium]|nr:flagellar basal-body protein FlbY [Alphaproteobacteria bacterium]